MKKDTLAHLASVLAQLVEERKDLPLNEDSFTAIEWRYDRLLWQDSVNLALLGELNRIANAMESRNKITREMLLDEVLSSEFPKQEADIFLSPRED